MKILFAFPLAVLLGAASVPPTEVQTGRSVAVDKAPQTYWLSDDLNRLFLQRPTADASNGNTPSSDGARR